MTGSVADEYGAEVVAAWLMRLTVGAPLVSKSYDLLLPVRQEVHKVRGGGSAGGGASSHAPWSLTPCRLQRIAYTNQWDRQRRYRFESSDPSLVRVKQHEVTLEARESGAVRLVLGAQPRPMEATVYLFVKEGEWQTEECLLLRVRWE